MMWFVIISLLAISISNVHSTSYNSPEVPTDYYQDAMMQALYKRLSELDQSYFRDVPDFENDIGADVPSNMFRPSDSDYAALAHNMQEERSPGQTDIRDSEYLAHGSNAANGGYIYVSGGAGEGKQHLNPEGVFDNIEQIKSDESLPFYCHPPNPCPKGYTSEQGCQEFIEDTAEEQQAWIRKMQSKGLCSCDEEHMFNCPEGETIVSKVTGDSGQNKNKLDEVIDKILSEKSVNPYAGGQKRQSLVAKKSPRVKRSTNSDMMESELEKLVHVKRNSNPYLEGEKLRTVAKKGDTKI